jgi:hypothetical protein
MKVIFLVIASDDEVHERDLRTQELTWVSQLDENAQVIWLRGHPGSDFLFEDRTLYVPCNESYQNILEKTILGLQYIVDKISFDLIIRTNVSTYFSLSKLRKELSLEVFKTDFYGGFLEWTKKSHFSDSEDRIFVSGTGIFLSRRAVDELVELDHLSYQGIPDDVAISHFLSKTDLTRIPMMRNSLSSSHIFFSSYFIRTKSSADSMLASKRMKMIYEYFSEEKLFLKISKYLQISRFEMESFRSHPEGVIKYFARNRVNLLSNMYAGGYRLWLYIKQL